MHNLRDPKTGRFASKTPNIVNGRLYELDGVVVRAKQLCGAMRLVSVHNTLFGLVPDHKLKVIDKAKVNEYLFKSPNIGMPKKNAK